MQLDGIKAGLFGPCSGIGKVGHHLRNIVQVHDPDARLVGADAHKISQLLGRDGLHHVALGHFGDGGHPHLATVDQVLHRGFATVLQLNSNLGAVAVHPIGEAA